MFDIAALGVTGTSPSHIRNLIFPKSFWDPIYAICVLFVCFWCPVFHDPCLMFHVPCSMFHVSCFMFHVSCFMCPQCLHSGTDQAGCGPLSLSLPSGQLSPSCLSWAAPSQPLCLACQNPSGHIWPQLRATRPDLVGRRRNGLRMTLGVPECAAPSAGARSQSAASAG